MLWYTGGLDLCSLILCPEERVCSWYNIAAKNVSCPCIGRINFTQIILGFLQNLYNLLVKCQSSSSSPSLSSCRSSGNHSQRLFEKRIKGFDTKINGAALRHSLGGSNGREQTQRFSKSAAIAAGLDRLAWGKRATTLAIQTRFDSHKGFNTLLFLTPRQWSWSVLTPRQWSRLASPGPFCSLCTRGPSGWGFKLWGDASQRTLVLNLSVSHCIWHLGWHLAYKVLCAI